MSSDATRELSRQMLAFHRLYNERISRRFQALKMRNLSHAETFLMCILLDRPGLALGELVNRTMMSKQQINHILNQLEEKALIERVRPAENRRIVVLRPTDAARALAADVTVDAPDGCYVNLIDDENVEIRSGKLFCDGRPIILAL